VALTLSAQEPAPPGPPSAPVAAGGQPIALDLAGAIERAAKYSQHNTCKPTSAAGLARGGRVQAKAALFPTLNLLNQVHLHAAQRHAIRPFFVANDGVHVYSEQAMVHAELFSLSKRAEYPAHAGRRIGGARLRQR